MPKHTELYERLELSADADEAAIKKAYRKVRAPCHCLAALLALALALTLALCLLTRTHCSCSDGDEVPPRQEPRRRECE